MISLESAKALHRSGEFDRAQAIYYQILEQQPENVEVIYLLSTILFDQKSYKPALEYINRGLVHAPKSCKLLTLKGDIFRHNSFWKEALLQYLEVLKLEKVNAELLLNVAFCYVKEKDYASAKMYVDHIWKVGEMKLQTAKAMCECYILMAEWPSVLNTLDALYMGGIKEEHAAELKNLIVDGLKALTSPVEHLINLSSASFNSYQLDEFFTDIFLSNKRAELALECSLRSLAKQEKISVQSWDKNLRCYSLMEDHEALLKVVDSALEDYPNSGEFLFYKATALRNITQNEAAIEVYLQCIELCYEHSFVWYGMGLAYSKLIGKENECIHAYTKSFEADPSNVSLLINLGTELVNIEQFELGRLYFRLARKLDPENEFALQLLAHTNVHLKPNEFKDATEEAILCCEQLNRLCPDNIHTLNNRATLYQNLLRVHDSIPFAKKSLEQKIEQEVVWCVYLFHLHYQSSLSPRYIADEHKRWASIFEKITPLEKITVSNQDPSKKLRVGFVSSDMYYHPVAYFLISVLKEFDSDEVETFIYSGRKDEDDFSRKVKAAANHWRRVKMLSDEEFSTQVQKDEIDILIDLSGHTTGNRMGVFFKKPAPIQAAWMGYPNTTGMSRIDYRISDSITEPEGEADEISSEKIVRIENGFHSYVPFYKYPEVAELPALKRGYITFGSFNNIRKLSPGVISLWAKILKKVPHSHLILKDRHFDVERNCNWVLSMFAANGISERRINLLGMMSNNVAHMRSYSLMDIALDSFPYNGTTTTCEALVNGVPVVGLLGNSHVSRVTSSLLTHAGYPEWVAENDEEYVKIACDIASDPTKLAQTRKELRTKFLSSPVGDPNRLAVSLQKEFRKMWQKWCNENSISADN